jgi:hypothetical protein
VQNPGYVFPPRHPAIASQTVPVVGEIEQLGRAKLTSHTLQGFLIEQLLRSAPVLRVW